MDTPFGREGSKGGGIAFGDEYMCRLSAAHTVITVTVIIPIAAAAQYP